MFNTTALAVGLSVAVPTLVAVCVFTVFWFRQKKKYQQDVEEHSSQNDYDLAADLDLDNIVDSPHEMKRRKFTQNNNNIPSSASMDGDQKSDMSLENMNTILPDVVLMQGQTAIRKSSKIMGLKLVPKDSEHILPPNTLSQSNHSVNVLTKRQSDNNYKAFYESVIPVLADDSGSPGPNNINRANDQMNPAQPFKQEGQTSSHSSMDLYKLLQEDTSKFPDSRVTSMMLGESPLRQSKAKSSLSSMHSLPIDKDSADPFNTPQREESSRSPLNSPNVRRRIDLHSLINDDSVELDDKSLKYSKNAIVRKSHGADFFPDQSDDEEEDDDDDENDAYIVGLQNNSPTKNRIPPDSNNRISEVDVARQNYQNSRREWLSNYKPN